MVSMILVLGETYVNFICLRGYAELFHEYFNIIGLLSMGFIMCLI